MTAIIYIIMLLSAAL